MILYLRRHSFFNYGIFGELVDGEGDRWFVTLEHAYPTDNTGEFKPKLPAGQYECVRGEHHLDHVGALITYEVKNVPGHTGVLFHMGNYNKDSDGCILLGTGYGNCLNGDKMLVNSIVAFNQFMKYCEDLPDFILTVEDCQS